ncbi:SapC family protein [Henriciella sp. AS95]|uniref:SapC family protein n=1 Tax=Henriciella sp. AS95 TaxID=3135782 RepID=UPI00316D9AF2
MENTQPAQPTPLSGQVLFYSNPQPLSAEKHAGLGIKQVEKPFAFLGKAHAVPLTVNEFGLAATSYPILFVGEERTPIGAMGIRQNENLFVTAEGEIDADYYVPAFARRYPFVFANDQQAQRLLLCVDRDAEMVSNQPEVPFFENGELSPFTKNAMEFCQEFERQRQSTEVFVRTLRDLDLFTMKSATFQPRDPQGNPTGDQQTLAEYWAIDEQKVQALPAEKAEELNRNGVLAACAAASISLLNWSRLINRALKTQNNPITAANQSPTPQGGSEGPSFQI